MNVLSSPSESQSQLRQAIRFVFRGAPVEISDFAPHTTLLDWLRLEALATGTKEGCGEGDCGACTVALARQHNGKTEYLPVNACIFLLGQADGAEIVTIEDLAVDGALHPVQQAMVTHHGSQCGFCTPGIVMSLFTLYRQSEQPVTRDSICDALAGNLCRCTGYRPIIDAMLDACATTERSALPAASGHLTATGDEDIFIGDESSFFAAPATETTLAKLYAKHPDAHLVGGATDFGLTITKGLAAPKKVIWLGRVRGFDDVRSSATEVSLGAGARLADAAPLLRELHPDLGEVMRRFGSAQVRASGTVGGNIANGSPIGDLAPSLIALGATIELQRRDIRRTLPLEDFFLAYKKQDRQVGEFVRRIIVKRPAATDSVHIYKVSKRFDEDISAVLAAFKFTLEGRRIVAARTGFGGMAAIPSRARKTEAACLRVTLDDERTWTAALNALADDLQPIDDMRASAAYRQRVARNLLRKAFIEAGGGSATRLTAHSLELTDAAE
ncbi:MULTISPECIES: xanthine dehydrogenase small subunit [unclassified Beijerinckia]|uniref:xanthine dehydrogenase small subunit n=1 Tax=unclassified Beijerinckia TaxID=2638183 RepID=UPI001FCDF167|nr:MULTISPECIES: xanthine dehydrogenase small subunit [unclassified Beijerinckia]MDH7795606.1 xanthine dehydrogenase small subunit [Beijerinckia sp. GAS462]